MNLNNFEYFIVLALVLFFPFVFSFNKQSYISGQIRSAITAIAVVAPIWIIYDVWATSRGHWSFNDQFIVGPKFINLPLEEVLFFIVVPYSCLFVWTILRDFSGIDDFINRIFNKK